MKPLLKALVVATFVLPLVAFAYEAPGKPNGFVNDFAGVLSADQKASLEQLLTQNEKDTGNEISIAIIKNLGGDTVDNFAEKLYKEWGIGKKGADNGALLLVSIDDRQMRIEVGYGLEPVLTDALSGQIIRNIITPAFKQGDYYGGIRAGAESIIAATKGEIVSGSSERNGSPWWGNVQFDAVLFWLFLSVFQWIVVMMSRSKSWWLGGVFGGVFALIAALVASAAIGILLGIILVPLGLLLDYLVSREYAASQLTGRKPRWWAGGGPWLGGGGFGGRGGGFGGFGGGRSGGGGASGGW